MGLKEMGFMSFQKDIPTGKIKRGSLVGLTTARAGIKKVKYLSKKPFMSEVEKESFGRQNDEEIAKIIFKALSCLRGTALKAAQMLSMEMELLPEEYRKELAKAASNVPPINRALIRKIITTQLCNTPEKVFKTFESVPFAAASLGQVHKALTVDGEDIAVKVQYPGIASGIKSDIDMVKAIIKSTIYLRVFGSVFDEIEERITEELDYCIEAENTSWFRDNLELDYIIVPEVHQTLSTKNVITTSYIHGLHIDEWIETKPPQDVRNHYGQLLADLFNYCFYEKNIIHADPNTGNYLFRDDGKLGIIDFGCVKKFNDNIIEGMILCTKKDFHLNPDNLEILYQKIGVNFNRDFNDPEFNTFIVNWVEWITRPQNEDTFDFFISDQYFNEGMQYVRTFYKYVNFFSGEFVYFGRAQYGLYRLLQKLGAKVTLKWPTL